MVIEFPRADLTHPIMGKMSMYSILHVVKTFPMLPAHRTDYLPTPIEIRPEMCQKNPVHLHNRYIQCEVKC